MELEQLQNISTPCYVCEEELLEKNLKLLDYVQKESGAKIILALKGFAMWSTFPLVSQYLKGCTSSGLYEARLAREEFCKHNPHAEVHTYSPAYKDEDIDEIAKISDHIVFNSPSQLFKYKERIKEINPHAELSLRINPEVSSSPKDIYNPCGIYSRLGTTLANFTKETKGFDEEVLKHIDGLNFHALCEQNVDALEEVLVAFEEKFSKYFKGLKYINFGGGHHITKEGYDVEKLIRIIKAFREKYDVEVYLEPGEAVGWQTGFLVATVLDVFHNGMDVAILDTSAEAHMPDTLAMPYRADVRGSGEAGEKPYTYRLGGNTCLAGDIMGDYSFDMPLKAGDKVIFEDQIHYTFVKNTTFNGIKLPSLAIYRKDGTLDVVKEFGYEDYRDRLS
ncbi:MAG: carboxynorspermidine decarboxylase [Epsilonproteobacteria bacterium]|nr:carboxynorspermidine decarboxylase [Campylobacterota bacterium]OIO13971.1 MAG: carboxynorspermidine decarboxylase [Helicobacteraceae bacterium CG1_02_36_14]PIP10093.1 MAG: carboxynorspermidine decarboxylase [Sulfurimonas sp. CG23_combo_of_CG06-09_8_20_14_all_36_33]PIS26635.1 MAG: carboxynorspermidine decarboxylase [Sulfurimonas sp. CG08_land_8_20_14_0_20_36_33]PIU33454.1 MAG: carboxynorspermidine decarboxylase [Sulfurimonas sp. CG07_land_8_20_14_0_80_36_56]PIV05640.1 MAG: carboxynorspermidi